MSARPKRRHHLAAAGAVAVALVCVAACDSSTTYVPPSFDLSKVSPPVPPTTAPPPTTTPKTVILDPPTTGTTTTTTTVLPIGDPVLTGGIPPGAPIDVDPPTTPPPPPTCDLVNSLVGSVTGRPVTNSGGEDFDQAAGHDYRKCFGTSLPSGELTGNNRSSAFEAWVFPAGQLPAPLATGASEVLTPSAFAPSPALGADVTSTAGSFLGAKGTSTASRAVRFPCGTWECWLYLEQGAYAPPDPDLGPLDAAITTIIDGLRTGVGAPAPATSPTGIPAPDCQALEAPIQDLVLAAKQVARWSLRAYEPYDPANNHPYVRCDGALRSAFPPGVAGPFEGIRDTLFQFFASPHDFRLTTLDSFAAPTDPAPQFGADLLAIEYPLTIFEYDKSSPPKPITSRASAVITFRAGAWDCWLYVVQDASNPIDTTPKLFEGQLKYYLDANRAYIASLG